MSDERELRKTLEKAQGRVKALESELRTIRAELAKPRPASDAEFLALTAEVQRLRVLKSNEGELRQTLEEGQGQVKALKSELQTLRAELAKPRSAREAEFLALTAEVQRLRLLEAAPDAERALSELRAEVHRLRASTERAAAAEGAQRELRADVNQLTQERLELRASVKHLEAAARERRSRPAPSNYDGARQAGEVATLKHERDQLKAKLKEITTERDQLKSTGSSPMKKSTP